MTYWFLFALTALTLLLGVPLLDWWLRMRARRERRAFRRFVGGRP